MSNARISRRRLLGAMGAAGALAVIPGCKKGGDKAGGGRVKVGLVVPQAGVYASVGTDMKRGWDLWLERHGGKLGKYEVDTVVADEGETPQAGVPAGIALGVKDMVAEAKKLLIVGNAGAGAITGGARTPYIWRTSFTNAQVSSVMGKHLSTVADVGPVYLIAPDYAAGTEVIRRRSARPRISSRSSPASSRRAPRPRSASSPAPRRSRSSSSTPSSGCRRRSRCTARGS